MTSTENPRISVVMPVHNALPFLDLSIHSILNQTLSDFEFLILDDASTDGSRERIQHWSRRDTRIHLHHSDKQLGLAASSNAIVAKARAPIIARMDADDISHPDRLCRQMNIMKQNSDVAVVGTLCNGIDAGGRQVRPRDRWRLVRRSYWVPFPHGTAMFRRKVFEQVGGYDENTVRGEDQDLFSKMASRGRVVTLPDVLYSYRYHCSNTTLTNGTRAVEETHHNNGDDELAALYMLGAMRLWSGGAPGLLDSMLQQKSLKWNFSTLMILGSAVWGQISPASLRGFLRSLVRVRDRLASLWIKDGKAYEWRLE